MHLLVFVTIILSIRSSIDMFNALACNIKKKYDEKNYLNINRSEPHILHEIVLSKDSVHIYTERHNPALIRTKTISNTFSKKFDKDEIDQFALKIFQIICLDSNAAMPIYLNIKNETPGYLKSFLIYVLFKNFKDYFKSEIDFYLEYKYINVEAENSFIHNLLTKKNNNCYADWYVEDNKIFIIFCIEVEDNYHIFKVDVKDLNCDKVFFENVLMEFGKSNKLFEKKLITNTLKLYNISDILIGAKKNILPQVKYLKTGISVNKNANLNIVCTLRKFSVKIKKDKIVFKNLNNEFRYDWNYLVKSKIANNYQIYKKTFDEVQNILAIHNVLYKNNISYPKMFFNVLHERNLVINFISSILKKPETGSFLLLIHLLGNLGICTVEELITISEMCDLRNDDSEQCDLSILVNSDLVKIINDSTEFDTTSLFKLLLLLEANEIKCSKNDTADPMFVILNQLKDLQIIVDSEKNIDVIKIHQFIFKESQCFINAAIKTLNMIFEDVDRLIKSYKIKNASNYEKKVKIRKVRSKELIMMDPLDLIIS